MKAIGFTTEDVLEEVCAFLHERLIYEEMRVPIQEGSYTIVAPLTLNKNYWYWCVFKALSMFNELRYGSGVDVIAQSAGTIHILVKGKRTP